MTASQFALPETVDLASAKTVADDLLKHIRKSGAPSVTATGLLQGDATLLQILVAARTFAAIKGKPFTVQADPDGALARLLATYGLDPALCGAPADLVPSAAAAPSQRT
jgi:anti-anti-sigma regulatory factor